jgi:hypothetical protein
VSGIPDTSRQRFTATAFIAGASHEVLADGVALEGNVTADGSGFLNTTIAAPSEPGPRRRRRR